jgi:small subunit ribosomal protein S16
LSRTGRSKIPTYRIVVAEKSAAVKGKYHEAVGYFNPALETPELTYDRERIEYWISKGAQPSETLARILAKDGFAGMEKYYDAKKKYQKKSKKDKKGAEGAEGEEKPADEKPAGEEVKGEAKGEEAPAEEAKEEKPVEEAPAEEKPAEETPKGEEEKEEAPKEETEAKEA